MDVLSSLGAGSCVSEDGFRPIFALKLVTGEIPGLRRKPVGISLGSAQCQQRIIGKASDEVEESARINRWSSPRSLTAVLDR